MFLRTGYAATGYAAAGYAAAGTVFITVIYKASRVDYAVINNSLLHHSGVQSIKQHSHALLRLAAVRIF